MVHVRVSDPRIGGVAQLGEHLLCKQGVSGSSPLISTNGSYKRDPEKVLLFVNVSQERWWKNALHSLLGPIAQLVRAHD